MNEVGSFSILFQQHTSWDLRVLPEKTWTFWHFSLKNGDIRSGNTEFYKRGLHTHNIKNPAAYPKTFEIWKRSNFDKNFWRKAINEALKNLDIIWQILVPYLTKMLWITFFDISYVRRKLVSHFFQLCIDLSKRFLFFKALCPTVIQTDKTEV